MFENPRRGRQARNLTTNAPKILDLKSSSEQIFSRKLPLGAPAVCVCRSPLVRLTMLSPFARDFVKFKKELNFITNAYRSTSTISPIVCRKLLYSTLYTRITIWTIWCQFVCTKLGISVDIVFSSILDYVNTIQLFECHAPLNFNEN